jgi:hypothetical protein
MGNVEDQLGVGDLPPAEDGGAAVPGLHGTSPTEDIDTEGLGPTDPRIVGPYGQPGAVLGAHEDCSPYFNESVSPNLMPDCDHQKCVRGIAADMVLEAVNGILQSNPHSATKVKTNRR